MLRAWLLHHRHDDALLGRCLSSVCEPDARFRDGGKAAEVPKGASVARPVAGPAAPKTNPSDAPPGPSRLVRSSSFTAAIREICEEVFNICDKNRNKVLDKITIDEYIQVNKRVYSLFPPEVRAKIAGQYLLSPRDP